MKTLLNIILWVWQLPQNLLGLLLALLYHYRAVARVKDRGVIYWVVPGFRGGISLGKYIIVSTKFFTENSELWLHEYGHCRQSVILGPLYLLAIGLPSLIHAALYRPEKGNYYDFYTEKWADRLGGVNRNI